MVEAKAVTGDEYGRLVRLATYASVATAFILIAVKVGAWLMTGSVSVLASLVDSLMDAAASLINFFAVRLSLRPADNEHRFGHGKAESLAGLGQSAFIAGSAVFLTLNAIDRLINPQPLEHSAVGVMVMAIGIALTLVLLLIQRHVIAKTQSTAVRADSLHYLTDVFTNAAAIVALWLVSNGWQHSDPIIAMIIAAFIVYSAWQIGREAIEHLMDRELGPEVEQQLRGMVMSTAGVSGVHDIRTRKSGHRAMIQLHLEFAGNWSLERAHKVTKQVEAKILVAYPQADVIIHQDPVPEQATSLRQSVAPN